MSDRIDARLVAWVRELEPFVPARALSPGTPLGAAGYGMSLVRYLDLLDRVRGELGTVVPPGSADTIAQIAAAVSCGATRDGRGDTMGSEIDDLAVDWADVERAGVLTRNALLLIDDGTLDGMLERVRAEPPLADRCWSADGRGEVVLVSAPDRGFELALRERTGAGADEPHAHGYAYSSRILHGPHRQTWYDAATGREMMTRLERPGSRYTIDGSMVHAVESAGPVVSLVLRDAVAPVAAPPGATTGTAAYESLRDLFASLGVGRGAREVQP